MTIIFRLDDKLIDKSVIYINYIDLIMKAYLSHIGGLRGLAILMVVLFHLFPLSFSQGFLGVDVFFVISGYLLFRGGGLNVPFKFGDFLQKKVLRIMPPFVCMLLFAGVCAIPVLFSESDIIVLGSSILYSLAGMANRYYQIIYADYFSAGANMNPLLHTWYLAVILQVYVIWAIACVVLTQLKKVGVHVWVNSTAGGGYKIHWFPIACVVLVGMASLIYWYSYQIQDLFVQLGMPTWGQTQEVSYYSTFGRLWQIAAGGLVCILPIHRTKWINSTLASMGLILIILFGCCNVSLASCGAFVVVIASVMLLRYAPNTPINRMLDMKWLQYLGRVSFSLYLIHFPLIVIYKRWEKLNPDILSGSLILVLIVIFAWILWFAVEKRKWKLCWTLLVMTLAGVFSIALRYEKMIGAPIMTNFKFEYPVYHLSSEAVSDSLYVGYNSEKLVANSGTMGLMHDRVEGKPQCIMPIGECTKPEFVLIGDSNTQHLYSGFHELSKNKLLQGVHLTTIIVPLEDRYVYFDDPGYNWDKEKSNALYAWLSSHPEIHTVVISNLWSSRLFARKTTNWDCKQIEPSFADNAEMLRGFCSKLKQIGKHVVLVMPSPIFRALDKELYGTGVEYARWLERRSGGEMDIANTNSPFVLTNKEYTEYYKQVLELFNKWEDEAFCSVLHIEKSMFKDGNFLGLKNGTLYCRDDTHITPPAAIEIMEGVADEFEQLIIRGRKLVNHAIGEKQ